MISFLKKYKEIVKHKHGWDVELKCPQCNYEGLPEYKGWTPAYTVHFGKKATIFTNLFCPGCKKELKEEAGKKLIELFSDIPIHPKNKRILRGFLLISVGIILILILSVLIFSPKAFTASAILPVLIALMIFIFNYKIASIRTRCDCGKPDYIFMGMLGRSYCYCCATCKKSLRLRD